MVSADQSDGSLQMTEDGIENSWKKIAEQQFFGTNRNIKIRKTLTPTSKAGLLDLRWLRGHTAKYKKSNTITHYKSRNEGNTQKTATFPSIRPNLIEQKDCHGMINDEMTKFLLLAEHTIATKKKFIKGF